jgi:hypothetical protein
MVAASKLFRRRKTFPVIARSSKALDDRIRAKRAKDLPKGFWGVMIFASIIVSRSCPAKAGHPVITESLEVTGSPAFAGDDRERPTVQPKIITP